MNAIMIVLVPAHNGQSLTEQAGSMPGLEIWQCRIDRGTGNTDRNETSSRPPSPAPYWTWFVENPRSCWAA